MPSHYGRALNLKDAAAYTGLSSDHLRKSVARGEIAYVRMTDATRSSKGRPAPLPIGRLRFCERDLDAYIESRRVPAKLQPAKAELPARASAAASPDDPLAPFMPPMDERRFA